MTEGRTKKGATRFSLLVCQGEVIYRTLVLQRILQALRLGQRAGRGLPLAERLEALGVQWIAGQSSKMTELGQAVDLQAQVRPTFKQVDGGGLVAATEVDS